MDNISILLERLASGSILMNNNIIYDGIIEQDGNISYDTGTGVVTLSETGKYCAFWWIATQASLSTIGMAFDLITSQGDQITGNSPIKTDEVTGFGVIDVVSAPITLSIQNTSNNTVYYSTSVDTKASLMIVKIPEIPVIPTVAYGGLFNEIVASLTLPAGTQVQVPMQDVMVFENVTNTTNTIIVNIPGNYQINYMLNFSTVGVSTSIQYGIRVNSSVMPELSQATILSTTTSSMVSCSAIIALNAGDVVDLFVLSAAGGSVSFIPGTNALFAINKIGSDNT